MSKKAKIIVVDDSEFSRQTISSILTEAGHNIVATAANAEEAIQFASLNPCDLFIIDVVMPDSNGIDLADYIKNKYEDSKIIMISSLNMDDIVLDAIRSGALDFITKPFEKHELIDSVQKVLNR